MGPALKKMRNKGFTVFLGKATDDLFDVLMDAFDRDAHEVRVTYDEATGIPADIWIDYEENTADEELGFAVTVPIDTDPGS